jgi:sulfur carrier protein
MNILCNEKPASVESPTLDGALLELGYESAHVATAINGEFIPRSLRTTTTLQPGDKLDVVAPMQGG